MGEKKLGCSTEVKRGWIEWEHPELSVRHQCALVGLARSTAYYAPTGESAENLQPMRVLDELYTRRPFYGRRRMTIELGKRGHLVNEKRVARLLAVMGLEAVYPRRRLSIPAVGEGPSTTPACPGYLPRCTSRQTPATPGRWPMRPKTLFKVSSCTSATPEWAARCVRSRL